MTVAEPQKRHAEVFAARVRQLDLEVRTKTPDSVTLALPVHVRHVHALTLART